MRRLEAVSGGSARIVADKNLRIYTMKPDAYRSFPIVCGNVLVPRRGLPSTRKHLIWFDFIPKKPVKGHHMVVLTRWQGAVFYGPYCYGNDVYRACGRTA